MYLDSTTFYLRGWAHTVLDGRGVAHELGRLLAGVADIVKPDRGTLEELEIQLHTGQGDGPHGGKLCVKVLGFSPLLISQVIMLWTEHQREDMIAWINVLKLQVKHTVMTAKSMVGEELTAPSSYSTIKAPCTKLSVTAALAKRPVVLTTDKRATSHEHVDLAMMQLGPNKK